jgi:hypothetical protein
MIYVFFALVGLSAAMVVGLVLWLANFLKLGKFLLLLSSLSASIMAVLIWSLLVVGFSSLSSRGNLPILLSNPDYAWNVARAIVLPSLFGSLIVGVTLYAGARLCRRKERRIAGIALLVASAFSLFLLFLISGSLFMLIGGG